MNRTIGYIDEINSTAVLGWIANLDMPEQLETVVCRGANGGAAHFRPFIPRWDVCQALSLVGRFGFAIPTISIKHLGPIVAFTDQDGVPLTGGEQITLPFSPCENRLHPTWVFLHIQKTAGTSLRLALTAAYESGEAAFVYPDPVIGLSPKELGTLPAAQRAALRLVVGHCYFGIGDLIQNPSEYVTVVREPEARLRSHYYHHCSHDTRFRIDSVRIPTSRIVQHGLTDEFDNLMTRMIAGVETDEVCIGGISERHVDLALNNIATRFRFVAVTECLREHFPALCQALGVTSGELKVENVRRVQGTERLDAAVDWEEALHRNRFDAMLYSRICKEGLSGRSLVRKSR